MVFSETGDGHFIETPRGLFTSAGNWFHITRQALDTYAPGLLDKVPLEKIIKQSEIWIRSTDNLGILLFMLLLWQQGITIAVLATLLFVTVWHIYKSSFVSLPLTAVLRVTDKEAVVLLVSLAVLSWKGMAGEYLAVPFGLAFFVILKFGWIRAAIQWVSGFFLPGTLLLNDRVLKMLVIRYALKENIPVREVDAMEKEILTLIQKQKEVFQKHKRRRQRR